MRFDGNFDGSPNYFPSSFGGPAPQPKAGEPPCEVSGMASRKAYTHPNDDFSQPGELYRRVMTDEDRDHLIGNIVDHLRGAKTRIQMRQTAIFYKAAPDYGRRVAEGPGLKIKDVERLAGMSKEERAKATDQAVLLSTVSRIFFDSSFRSKGF